jgi:hypothetical protein
MMAGVGLHLPPAMAATVAAPIGVFGNVRYIEEAGDLLGVEVRFFRRAGQPMAELTYCEGWCAMSYTQPVVRHGDGFEMGYGEPYTNGKGQTVAGPQFHFRFTPVGRHLKMAMWVDGKPVDPGKEDRWLRPLARPYGLDVARRSMAACRREHRCE